MASKPTPTDSSQAGTFGRAADTVKQAASAIEERAERIPGGQKVKEMAQAAADTLGSTADYMRTHDTRRMVSDVEAMVRNNPGPALLIAGVVGFMLGRGAIRR